MYGIRRAAPKLTVRALYSILSVAISKTPLPYSALMLREDENYDAVAASIALLSDGRGKQKGMNLINRVNGKDRRSKCLTATPKAEAFAVYLASIFELTERFPHLSDDHHFAEKVRTSIGSRIMPALRAVLEVDPTINVTTLSTFLFICTKNQMFKDAILPTSYIAHELGVTNLSRNIAALSEGSPQNPGLRLIKLDPHPSDGRATVPSPTETGITLLAGITACIESKPDIDFVVMETELEVEKPDNDTNESAAEDPKTEGK